MTKRNAILATALIGAIVLTLSAGAAMKGHSRDGKPPAKEFGPGPRTSDQGLYVVALQGARDLEPRKMYTLVVTVIDGATGEPVTNATIRIDGGMPQHGHGLPTKPRITKYLENGWYELGGLRFSMGGWWVLTLTITTPTGTDTVTFNLSV